MRGTHRSRTQADIVAEARAAVLKQLFEQHGLKNVFIDQAGNVVGTRPGAQPRPNVVVSAHLDTVFPEGTDVTVKRDGHILRAPGIGDDTRGLAEADQRVADSRAREGQLEQASRNRRLADFIRD